MPRWKTVAWLALLAPLGAGEVIDRIAVTVDQDVITESMVVEHIRLSAFFDGRAPDFSPAAKRAAAQELINRLLLEREMDGARFPAPAMNEILAGLQQILRERTSGRTTTAAALAAAQLEEEQVRRFYQAMVRAAQFVELRFRRGLQVSSAEVASYYEKSFLPRAMKQTPLQSPPPLETVYEQVEEELLQVRTHEAMEEWLEQSRRAAKIRLHDEVFQ